MKIIHKLIAASLAVCALCTASAAPEAIHLQKGNQKLAVFGTVHLGKPDFYPLPDAVNTALSSSDALAVEMDITDPQIMQDTMKLMTAGALNSGGLKLDNARLKKLEAVIGPMATAFKDMPPAFAALMTAIMRAEQLGFTETGVDKTLLFDAKSQNKPIISLETPAEQLGAFDGIPDAEALNIFDTAVSDKGEEELHQAVRLWKTGDKKLANQLIEQAKKETPTLFKKLIIKRNQTMAKRIAEFNQKYPKLFVAVGTLHLYGSGSVVQLLEKAGYQRIDN